MLRVAAGAAVRVADQGLRDPLELARDDAALTLLAGQKEADTAFSEAVASRMRQLEVLPTSLGEALDALSQDDVVLSALGPYISDRYLAAKRQEFDEYNRQVTPWDLERYVSRY